MNVIQQTLQALRASGCDPKPAGKGWASRCPAHDDTNPSLSIKQGDDGRVLLHCHTGCPVSAVCDAIGVTMADLYPDDGKRGTRPDGRRAVPRVPVTTTPTNTPPGEGFSDSDGPTFPTAREAVAAYGKGRPAMHWTYHNAKGEPVGVVVRWNKPGGGKDIRPVSRTPDGSGWTMGGMPTPRPLYGLPDLLASRAASRVWVCEGEKTADAARSLGLLATTCTNGANGASNASNADWTPLAGRDVVVSIDHDAPGEGYGADVVKRAREVGAKCVRIVRLVKLWANMPKGGDMADYLKHRDGDADAVRAEVEALADQTEPEPSPDVRGQESPAVPLFDLDTVFPPGLGYVRDFVGDLSRSSQNPPEMVATLALPIVSATLSNVACVQGFGDHFEPAQLWGMVLCVPGARKTAVLGELQAPIAAWEKRQAAECGPLIAAAGQCRRVDEKRLRKLEEAAANSADRGKAEDLTKEAVELAKAMHADPIPTVPVLLASEPTPEALSQQMANNHGRALLSSAEGDSLDIMQGRYTGAANYGIYLKGHAGDRVRSTRVGRPGDNIDNPALAIALCVQPEAVRALWNDPNAKGRGLLARFAVIMPDDRIGFRDVRPAPIRPAVRARYEAAIARLLTFEPSDSPVIVTLSADADRLYHAFQKRTEKALGFGDLYDRKAWGAKLCGLALRIALTLHALETWALHGQPSDFPTIGAETMRAAIAWADWLAAAERHARERLCEDAEAGRLRELAKWLRNRGGEITASELAHESRAYRGDAPAAAADLNALAAAGYGEMVTSQNPKGGRVTQRFRLYPAVPVTETPAEPENCEGCGDSDEVDTQAGDAQGPDDLCDDPFTDGDNWTRPRPGGDGQHATDAV